MYGVKNWNCPATHAAFQTWTWKWSWELFDRQTLILVSKLGALAPCKVDIDSLCSRGKIPKFHVLKHPCPETSSVGYSGFPGIQSIGNSRSKLLKLSRGRQKSRKDRKARMCWQQCFQGKKWSRDAIGLRLKGLL